MFLISLVLNQRVPKETFQTKYISGVPITSATPGNAHQQLCKRVKDKEQWIYVEFLLFQPLFSIFILCSGSQHGKVFL